MELAKTSTKKSYGASMDMEFWVNSMSWRLTAPSELDNGLILKFSQLITVCTFKRGLVNCHTLFQWSIVFFKADQYLSVMS